MALAQAPAVFSLTGRNSIVQLLTGIAYQDLRFAHKVRRDLLCVNVSADPRRDFRRLG